LTGSWEIDGGSGGAGAVAQDGLAASGVAGRTGAGAAGGAFAGDFGGLTAGAGSGVGGAGEGAGAAAGGSGAERVEERVGETSQAGRLEVPGGGGSGSAALGAGEAAAAAAAALAACRDFGASVRSLISRTFRSRSDRKDEYSDFLAWALVRMTTITIATPRSATTGPTRRAIEVPIIAKQTLCDNRQRAPF
jgi:hypothetical protein